jgi:hypothetical protein
MGVIIYIYSFAVLSLFIKTVACLGKINEILATIIKHQVLFMDNVASFVAGGVYNTVLCRLV